MSGTTWITWLWWFSGSVLLTISLGLLVWALFWDRARGRKRCPRCWYDMSGATAPGLTCSECGKTVKRPRKLLKTRRRKRWALMALVGIIGAGYLAVQPRVKERGWWSLVSTKMLIAGLPFASDADDYWCSELALRVQAGTGYWNVDRWGSPTGRRLPEMTQEEYALFFDACVEGDARARPVSKAWRRKYGDLLEAWLQRNTNITMVQGTAADAEEDRLLALPLALDFETREPWPTDATPFVKVRFGCWWPRHTQRRAIVSPRDATLHRLHVMPTYPGSLALPEFDEEERAFIFDVVYEEQAPGGGASGWVEIGREEKALIVRRAGTTADALKPLNEAACSAMVDALQATAHVEVMLRDGRWTGTVFNVQECRSPAHEGLAFGFAVDLMADGKVYLTTHHSIRGGVRYDFGGSRIEGDINQFLEAVRGGGEWTARFRSDPATALHVFDADRYWAGEFTIPLIVNDDAAPSRGPPPPQRNPD